MAGCCGPKCSKAFVVFFNLLFWFSGCALVALGVILLYDQMYSYLFTMLTADQLPPQILQYIAFGCIGLGGIILFVGFFGCCGALQDSKCMLGTYVFFLILVFLLEAAAAGLGLYGWFYFPTSIRREVQQKQLHNYGVTDPANEHFTNALNYVQYEFECCGIENKSDWDHSKWKSNALQSLGSPSQYGQQTYNSNKKLTVPKTCCTADKLQWQESEEPWNTPKIKNEEHCQGPESIDYKGYSYHRGCWEQIMTWYYRQQLCLTPTLAGLAFLQIIGIVFSICLIRNIGEEV
ncbi:CD9 antigen [Folsomia candida]|uniref:Tetraspanin n=1 Tax=Folsomia candida TaxID=158441 RepID=A0A226EMV1_FOLCA|nr:CD9 antigen [Folsomia candida]XP_021944804.1 CD9 antigen [Folsomia candida]XP_021944805.1 CD9 antigen [Folsomia candida]XP_035702972.1 CD9 antigen [Folsomia candida]XP_035702973.1 CD9 antigen [Folsomia candida]OXA58962.1 Tetraspanin-33 [Folsomia candida]